ncbi:hypothetical protein L0F63_001303 [Massospora cicadina]|nr:hypothetical protein L0F63_001303 [Massospora cicadina]
MRYLLIVQVALSMVVKRDVADVWYELPSGFDQSQPDTILDLFEPSEEPFPFKNVYMFGDSTCDFGNYFRLSKYTDPDPKVYWKGRESNGPMWPDYLIAMQGLNLKNIAYGGSVISNENYINADFAGQVKLYMNDTFPKDSGLSPLALISFVGNDLNGFGITAKKVASDMEKNLKRLIEFGEIKDYLVILTPTEYFANLGFNKEVSAVVKKLQAAHPNLMLRTLDPLQFYQSMAAVAPSTADPEIWAKTDVPCYNQNTKSHCTDPQNHLRFDLYHPSTVPNYNLARFVADAIPRLWD